MYILGISAFYHDSAACLLKDGEIIAASQEERFSRIKHDHSFPSNAIKYCLEEGNIYANQIDNVVFYEKPFVKFNNVFLVADFCFRTIELSIFLFDFSPIRFTVKGAIVICVTCKILI